MGRAGVGCEREVAIACGRCLLRTFVGDCGPERRLPFSLRMLVFRPRDAKKPVPEPFVPGRGICRVLVGDRIRVDDRAGARWSCTCAREG